MHKLIQNLSEQGWKVKQNDSTFCLPPNILQRFCRIPVEVNEILSGLDECVAPDEKSWILCQPDYYGDSNAEFTWDEIEKQSLDAAEKDEEWEKEIVAFWNIHFPIYLSVRDGYEYVAISLSEETFGKVVSGREPEYEETNIIAETICEFLGQLIKKPEQ